MHSIRYTEYPVSCLLYDGYSLPTASATRIHSFLNIKLSRAVMFFLYFQHSKKKYFDVMSMIYNISCCELIVCETTTLCFVFIPIHLCLEEETLQKHGFQLSLSVLWQSLKIAFQVELLTMVIFMIVLKM